MTYELSGRAVMGLGMVLCSGYSFTLFHQMNNFVPSIRHAMSWCTKSRNSLPFPQLTGKLTHTLKRRLFDTGKSGVFSIETFSSLTK